MKLKIGYKDTQEPQEGKEVRLMCVRVNDITQDLIADGSSIKFCISCGHKVYVSPSGIDLMKEERAAPICLQCTMEDMPEDEEIAPLNEKQKKELTEVLSKVVKKYGPKMKGESDGGKKV